MRVVFFSDTHLGHDLPVRKTRHEHRGEDFFANFQRVLDYTRDTRADLLIHGGDFFFRSKVSPAVVDRAYQSLFEFANSGIPVVVVPGNHERSVLPPSLFLNHPGVHVFDRPREFVIRDTSVVGFPYVADVRDAFTPLLHSVGRTEGVSRRILVFHHAVEGSVVGPSEFMFRRAPDVIQRADLPGDFDVILSGHIHRHQVLTYATPVVFCGSTERTSFAEIDEVKGFCELTFGDAQVHPEIRFVPLPSRPMFDFDGRGFATQARLLSALDCALDGRSDRSIVRVRLSAYPGNELGRELRRLVPGILQVSCPRVAA